MTTDLVDVSVTIQLGSRSRRLPLIALAAALHLPRDPLRLTLVGLVLASPTEERAIAGLGEPTEGADRSTIVPDEEQTEPFDPVDRSTNDEVLLEKRERPTARFLAELLDDLGNLPALERLLEATPTAVVTAALDETLALPAERIRRTRAAYFTAAVRRRLSAGQVTAS